MVITCAKTLMTIFLSTELTIAGEDMASPALNNSKLILKIKTTRKENVTKTTQILKSLPCQRAENIAHVCNHPCTVGEAKEIQFIKIISKFCCNFLRCCIACAKKMFPLCKPKHRSNAATVMQLPLQFQEMIPWSDF